MLTGVDTARKTVIFASPGRRSRRLTTFTRRGRSPPSYFDGASPVLRARPDDGGTRLRSQILRPRAAGTITRTALRKAPGWTFGGWGRDWRGASGKIGWYLQARPGPRVRSTGPEYGPHSHRRVRAPDVSAALDFARRAPAGKPQWTAATGIRSWAKTLSLVSLRVNGAVGRGTEAALIGTSLAP